MISTIKEWNLIDFQEDDDLEKLRIIETGRLVEIDSLVIDKKDAGSNFIVSSFSSL